MGRKTWQKAWVSMAEEKFEEIFDDGKMSEYHEFVNPEDLYQELIQRVQKYHPSDDISMIQKAYQTAAEAHKDQKRKSGEPYIIHPLNVAIVLADLELDKETIVAGILHDVVEDTIMKEEDLKREFGDDVALLVDGVTKLEKIPLSAGGDQPDEKLEMQAENLRKMFLAMAKDIRVIMIKLADRLHNMRTLGSMLPAKQFKIAGETLYLYAPLAHRLGLFTIKTELEDLSFKYEHPQEYDFIEQKLQASEESRNKLFEHFAIPVDKKLKEMGLHYEMKARVKSAYSIWNKMKKQHNTVDDIFDLFAIRIVIDCPPEREKPECWLAYSVVTDMYRPNPGRLKDWLSIPKSNGYESLHITVYGPEDRWVEVQIRTRRMDAIAEKGLAAHWKYKGIKSENNLDAWMANVRDILEAAHTGPMELMRNFKMDMYALFN